MELPTPADLKERRTELELTQSDLAERAEVSQPLIARIEGGDVDPRLSTLRRIVNALEEAEEGIVRAGDVMHDTVTSVGPDDSVATARDLMLQEGYSQLPVLRDGHPEGLISNSDIRQTNSQHLQDVPVAEVMHEGVTTVERDTPLDEINAYLDHHRSILVVEGGNVIGIITEADIAAWFD